MVAKRLRASIVISPTVSLCLALCAALTGCSSSHSPARGSELDDVAVAGWGDDGEAMQSQDMATMAPSAESAAPRMAKRMARQAAPAPMPGMAPPPPPEAEPEPPRQAGSRMVHYQGWANLRSTEPDKTIDTATAMVRKAGGYLERRSGLLVVLRVPTKQFDTLFQRLMRLGEVLSYSQDAEDITDSYQDTDMRLKVVSATLQRLEALVKQARTENQKMQLLERLRHLREEREVLEARKRELSALARFATITLQLVGHNPKVGGDAWQKDVKDFLWIHKLDPFNDARFKERKTLKFKAPDGMVVTRKRCPWRATGAQGSEFWGSRKKVEPRGDTRFWSEAVRLRLRANYKEADTSQTGEFLFNRFKSHGPNPYFYWVGVRAKGKRLDLIEFYFPSEALQTKELEAVLASVRKGA